jgi:NTP pyrophosphatase (non-canonical NTP hydrolase)
MHEANGLDPDLGALRERLRRFAAERDWDQFHTPKNLALAVSVEAGELLECFQWLPDTASGDAIERRRGAIEAECADVLLYLIRLADRLDFDLLAAAARKLEVNAERYPVAKARGNSRKYTELE